MKIRQIRSAKIQSKDVVFLRVDFNVPLQKRGRQYIVADDTKIRLALKTIEYIHKKGARLVMFSHLGRPKGRRVSQYSLQPVVKVLSKHLGKMVRFNATWKPETLQDMVSQMDASDMVLLENIRFFPHEEKNDLRFAKKISQAGHVFINDAFAVSHRAHASVLGLAKYLPSYAGFSLLKELKALDRVTNKPSSPSVLVLGGRKMETKLPLIEHMIETYDAILLGGALSNTFVKASGKSIGSSIYEQEYVSIAHKLLKKAPDKIVLPIDAMVATSAQVRTQVREIPLSDIHSNEHIFDIGPETIGHFASYIRKAKTIVWNGPMGYYEHKMFQEGSHTIAHELIRASSHAFIVAGGGETLDVLSHTKGHQKIDHISGGGGAMLSYLAEQGLPGVDVLMK